MSRVGEQIKQTRIASGITQKQLAKKLGVAESFVNEVECGRKVVNQNLIDRISKVLGKDINDISMSFEEQTYEEEKQVKREISKNNSKDKSETQEVWNDAFGSIIKNVPVYVYDLKKAISSKMLPIVGNKIEGYSQDKVFYIEIQDDDMVGFRINKGDIAFAHIIHEVENNAICLIEHGNERVIRQIKRLDSNKLLLISNRNSLRTETVEVKEIKVIAKLDRVEFKL